MATQLITNRVRSHVCTAAFYTPGNSVTDNGRTRLSSWITHSKSISIWQTCVVKLLIRGLHTVSGSVCCGPRHSYTHKEVSLYCRTSNYPEFIHALFREVYRKINKQTLQLQNKFLRCIQKAYSCSPVIGGRSGKINTLRTGLLNCLNARSRGLIFRHRASCI